MAPPAMSMFTGAITTLHPNLYASKSYIGPSTINVANEAGHRIMPIYIPFTCGDFIPLDIFRKTS
jgi:hypothetical protein